MGTMKGYPITFNIYAESEEEAKRAQEGIIGFISRNAEQGRAVSGAKITEALRKAESNAFIRNQISNFLKNGNQ